MSDDGPYTTETAIGALRLAFAASKDNETFVCLAEAILVNTVATPDDHTVAGPLFDQLLGLGGRFEVRS